jgi:hypothetical protein
MDNSSVIHRKPIVHDVKYRHQPVFHTYDQFSKIVHRNICEVSDILDRHQHHLNSNKQEIKVSIDQADRFINNYVDNPNKIKKITICDEEIDNSREMNAKRIRLLQKIYSLSNIENICLNLSDDYLYRYVDYISKHIPVNLQEKTIAKFGLERHLVNTGKMRLDFLPLYHGKIGLYDGEIEEHLIKLDSSTQRNMIEKLGLSDDKVVKDVETIQKYIDSIAHYIHSNYHYEDLTDLDKTKLVYQLLFTKMGYDIKWGNAFPTSGQVSFIQSYVEPAATLENRKGNCLGESRAMTMILDSKELGVKAYRNSGDSPLGSHSWVGVVSNNHSFQCCTSSGIKPFSDFVGRGYRGSSSYAKVFPYAYLNELGQQRLDEHIKVLRKTR